MADTIFTSVSLARQAEYKRTYGRLVERARGRVKEKGVHENHHIIPRSMGGSNEKSNIVALTYKEHFLAHWLLAKFTTGCDKIKMLRAISKMSQTSRKHSTRVIPTWEFELARRAISVAKQLWHKTPTAEKAHKKQSKTLRARDATPEGVASRKKQGQTLRSTYATPEGQTVLKDAGKKII